jgi:hypothetical protein
MITYALIFSTIVFYFAMSHVSYKYFERIKRAWWGVNIKRFRGGEIVEAVMWPISLPKFYLDMRMEIKAVNKGLDWADFHVAPEFREKYRKEFMETVL